MVRNISNRVLVFVTVLWSVLLFTSVMAQPIKFDEPVQTIPGRGLGRIVSLYYHIVVQLTPSPQEKFKILNRQSDWTIKAYRQTIDYNPELAQQILQIYLTDITRKRENLAQMTEGLRMQSITRTATEQAALAQTIASRQDQGTLQRPDETQYNKAPSSTRPSAKQATTANPLDSSTQSSESSSPQTSICPSGSFPVQQFNGTLSCVETIKTSPTVTTPTPVDRLCATEKIPYPADPKKKITLDASSYTCQEPGWVTTTQGQNPFPTALPYCTYQRDTGLPPSGYYFPYYNSNTKIGLLCAFDVGSLTIVCPEQRVAEELKSYYGSRYKKEYFCLY
ncbi:hypothetical protein HYZ64_03495 [Candidatus Berkelbacteria bacterium]|nr:hypothetical protein [Candidatus Berkelbacteria bacterium]